MVMSVAKIPIIAASQIFLYINIRTYVPYEQVFIMYNSYELLIPFSYHDAL